MNDNILDDDTIQPTDNTYQLIITWWESRRFKYNMIVGFLGVLCSLIILIQSSSGIATLKSLFVAALIYSIICNLAFCIGWVIAIFIYHWFGIKVPNEVNFVFYCGGILISAVPLFVFLSISTYIN